MVSTMANRTVLYVSGFSGQLRARDLAYEFERYGRLVRCDIPALKTPTSSPFAFIEFRREDDAEDAYYDMHGRMIDGRRITVQWAKRPPSAAWRHDGSGGPERREREPRRDDRRGDDRRDGGRDNGDARRDDRDAPRRRSPSPVRGGDREQDRGGRRSLSPRRDGKREDVGEGSRSPLPKAERDDHDMDREDDRERRDD
ncbi:uncharacterized protein MKK02DRAFT_44194 [Dioszegia hungarica]|uniref:RRM domain-containing protein n=1 Tax=Dioszegia hungarica TaxID=4972 RepID=A0AA38LVC2_9TREE|nr:uncharacterized protein MKK02DRAFT_44194 [Dioszegia hungarica]KAI9635504.1 hypothetical protein MKK02DRAFT_44194 [Dioszegia hungarica]